MKKTRFNKLFFVSLMVTPLFLNGCNSHTHTFNLDEPIWSWNSDKTEATLNFKCTGCDALSEDVIDDDITVIPGTPTCTEGAITTYIAEGVYQDKTFSDTKYEELDPLGHEFTSIVVTGINEEGYNALSTVDGITVTKQCVRGDSVIATSDEIEIEYQTDDDFLHYGDTSVTVKIKNSSLSKVVDVNVKKIVVDRPTEDTTSFVYNQNVQEYEIASSEYYYVEGNKKTDAGSSKVLVKLANGEYEDLCWDDGTSDDLEFDFTIAKATPVISGVYDSYVINCGEDLDVSDISTDIGELSIKLVDENENEFDVTNVKGGTYTLVAKVEGTNNINEAVATANVTVKHDENWPAVIASDPNAVIGNKQGSCRTCSEVLIKPVEYGDLNADWGFGFGMNGVTNNPGTIAGEFPEYGDSTRSAYRVWVANNETINAVLPKVDFNVFNRIQFGIHSNANTQNKLYTGVGYLQDDDIIPFGEHGNRVKYAIECVYDEVAEEISASIRTNYGYQNSFVITDEDVINGSKGITLKLHGGAWRQFVFDDISFAHACSEYIDVENIMYPGIEQVCKTCYKHKDVGDEEIIYTAVNDFGTNNKFGFAVDNSSITIGVDTSEEIGSLKIGGNQGAAEVTNLTLPLVNFTEFKRVKYVFSCNAAGSTLSIDGENTINTKSNTVSASKSAITMIYNEETGALDLSIIIDADNVLTTSITDSNVINGVSPVNVQASLKPWHYLDFSQLIINYSIN